MLNLYMCLVLQSSLRHFSDHYACNYLKDVIVATLIRDLTE